MNPVDHRYPDAPRQDLVEELHGIAVADPYRWLEDGDAERTVSWLAAQEDLFIAERAQWADTGDWRRRVMGLLPEDVHSLPVFRRARTFYRFRRGAEDQAALYVEEDGIRRTLIDPVALDPSGRTVLEAWEPCWEGDFVAYQLSGGGTEDSVLRVLDVGTGQVVDGPIDRVRRSPIAWLPGGRAFYYVRRLPPELNPGEERYHRRVYLHEIGDDKPADVPVFGEGRDKTTFYDVSVTADGRWLAITSTVGTDPDTEVSLADLHAGPVRSPVLIPVDQDQPSTTRALIPRGTGPHDVMAFRTTDKAPRGRVVTCTPADPSASAWIELIGERSDAVLDTVTVLDGPAPGRRLVLAVWARHATAEVTVHDLADGRELAVVPLPGKGVITGVATRPEGGHEAWLGYTDHATPLTVLRFDALSGAVEPWRAPRLPAGPRVRTDLETYRSADGTEVRMFVVSPHGRPDRPRPAILTGYGGFGVSMSPGYLADALAWARAGGVYAVACVRGGGEEGRHWHSAGTGAGKPKVFEDFAAAADHLVDHGWTNRAKLGIMGGSNGGLLVGAVVTRHPDKYAAAVCLAPLLDMARYEQTGLGPSWRPEYGTAEDPGQFRTLLSYSPYHHVQVGTAYPAVLFGVFDGDSRVDPLHARKMCAALQYASTGAGPVVLRTEPGVGHGVRPLTSQLGLLADVLAFFDRQLGGLEKT